MPARRQHASFEPIPPDLDLQALVEDTDNFQYVDRISCDTIQEQGLERFERLITLHVIMGGRPLVIDGYEEHLDPWTFQPRWLRDNHGEKVENARNISAKENLPLTIGHYLRNLGLLTEQYFEKRENYKDVNRQRIYLKDIDCPPVWREKVNEHIPGGLFYLNDSIGEIGGPGSVDEALPNASGRRKGKGIAIAGDLMSSLPPDMRAENLMCYIGHEGTYTPAHREMCASLGQNIMVEASTHVGDDGKPERPGSSIWFMTETKDRHLVAEYWLSVLGHDIEVEHHFAQIVAWQKAPFKTYIVEQKVGDFILIPPLAPHQVWNRGTRPMKVAWNRTTVETLEMAFREALPHSRMVCRDEQYKNKSIVYYTLLKYSGLLRLASDQSYRIDLENAGTVQKSKRVRQVQKDFKRLFQLWKQIMLSEMFDPTKHKEPCEFLPYDGNVTCAFCRGNIFNRFLSCKTCTHALDTETEEPYDVCMDCFAMGRSCQCQSNFKWIEQWKWKDLLNRYEEWRKQITELEGNMSTEMTLPEERHVYPKRTLAEICQAALKDRPWIDIRQVQPPSADESEEEEIQVNDDGTVKKIKKKNKTWLRNSAPCHVCCKRQAIWKMANCTTCDRWWCYGSLWRAHDLHPTSIMEDVQWSCPHCRKVCNTGACRKDIRQRPYQPKGTLLGHDTKKVADVRSMESLVDFGSSNLLWLGADIPGIDNPRIGRMMQEAAAAKADDATLDDRYALHDDDVDEEPQIEYSPVSENIDPALLGESSSSYRRAPNGFLDPMLEVDDMEIVSQEPAVTQETFAPVANMSQSYQDSDDTVDFESSYLHTDGTSQTNELHRKRPRLSDNAEIRLVPEKGRRLSKSMPSLKGSKATKQYQVEAEKKMIDEARRDGRYIIVYGKMKGRSKIAKLSVTGSKLRGITSRSSESRKPPLTSMTHHSVGRAGLTELIRSDIQSNGPEIVNPSGNNKKVVSKARTRGEEDDDYNSRERRRDGHNEGAVKSKRRFAKARTRIEDQEQSEESDTDADNAISQTIDTGTSRRTRGDLNSFEEMPANWKDRRGTTKQRDKAAGDQLKQQSLPARTRAGKTPKMSYARASTGGMEPDESDDDDEDFPSGASRAFPYKSSSRNRQNQFRNVSNPAGAMDITRSVTSLMEEQNANLSAKRALALDGSFESETERGSQSDEETREVLMPRHISAGRSVLASGKKVKIIGPRRAQEKASSKLHSAILTKLAHK